MSARSCVAGGDVRGLMRETRQAGAREGGRGAVAPEPNGVGAVSGDAPALEFDGVSKWYGDRVAVADVSFTLSAGVTGLLGHNGAGKTTALKLCAGFAAPSRGQVRLLGRDVRHDPSVFHDVGIVPDGDGLWPFLTAREVVEAMARLRGVADPRRRRTRRSAAWGCSTSPSAASAASPRACARA